MRIFVIFYIFVPINVNFTNDKKYIVQTLKSMTKHHHHHSHSQRRHNAPSTSAARRRQTLNRIMKIIVTIIALGVIGLVYWLYNN